MNLTKRLGLSAHDSAADQGEVILLALVVSVMSEVKAQAESLTGSSLKSSPVIAQKLLAELPQPAATLHPAQVARIALALIKYAGSPASLSVTEKLFEFCTPKIKESFGSLPSFLRLLQAPTYAPLHDFQQVEMQPLFRSDRQAWQSVVVKSAAGNYHHFVLGLQRMTYGPHENCWLVESLNPE